MVVPQEMIGVGPVISSISWTISVKCVQYITSHIKNLYHVGSFEYDKEVLSKLKLCPNERQAVIFCIAIFHNDNKKRMLEIFEKLKSNFPNFFVTKKISPTDVEATHFALHQYIHYVKEENCDKEIIDILIGLNNTVNELNEKGHTPLDIAILNGNERAFNILIEAGAKIYLNDMFDKDTHISPLNLLVSRFFHDKRQPKEKVLRMFKSLIKAGANPNIIYVNNKTAFMRTLGARSEEASDADRFDADVARIFINSTKLDFTCRSRLRQAPGQPVLMYTPLDFVTSEELKVEAEAQYIVKDAIKERFQNYTKRIVDLEREILSVVIKFPTVIGKLVGEYTWPRVEQSKFIDYGTTVPALNFLYSLTTDKETNFRSKIDELRVKLLTAKSS